MKLTWMGHSCFLLDSTDGTCVFDPYSPGGIYNYALSEQ